MNNSSDNPASNSLGQGISEDQIKEAVEASGYPLQLFVGDVFRNYESVKGHAFQVQDEWCFVDRDTKELRNIDLRCDLDLYKWETHPRVRPHLSLLVECKQSELPYIFFQSPRKPWLMRFPQVSGLATANVIVTTDDDPSSWTYSVPHCLGLDRDEFLGKPDYCSTFSKCVRKGPKIELSGSETYSNLVLPLVKALEHFHVAEAPPSTAVYFDCHATLALAVLDAPMLSVNVEKSGSRLTALPWIRLLRHEYDGKAERFEREHFCVLDVVHKDYLASYLKDQLLPFAQRFAERVLRHPTEIATGEGFVSGMGGRDFESIEERLKPRTIPSRLSRVKAAGRNVAKLIAKKGKRK